MLLVKRIKIHPQAHGDSKRTSRGEHGVSGFFIIGYYRTFSIEFVLPKKSVEQSPSLGANSSSASQETPNTL